jgi:hypothetical protein
METLDTARRERGRLLNEVARLDKVIAFLTEGDPKPAAAPRRRGRRHTPEQRQKMKDAWARRKGTVAPAPTTDESELAHDHGR